MVDSFENQTFSFPKFENRKDLMSFGFQLLIDIEDIKSRVYDIKKYRKLSLNAQIQLNAQLEIILGVRNKLELSNDEFYIMLDSLILNLENKLKAAKLYKDSFIEYSESLKF